MATRPLPGPYNLGPFQDVTKLQWTEEPPALFERTKFTSSVHWWYSDPPNILLTFGWTDPLNDGHTGQSWTIYKNDSFDAFDWSTAEEAHDYILTRPIMYDPAGVYPGELDLRIFDIDPLGPYTESTAGLWHHGVTEVRDVLFGGPSNVTFYEASITITVLTPLFSILQVHNNIGLGDFVDPFFGIENTYKLSLKEPDV